MKQKPQDLLRKKYRQICDELDSLNTFEKSPMKTDGIIGSEVIQRVSTIKRLVEMFSGIVVKEQAFKFSATLFHQPDEFLFGGFQVKDWENDVRTQIDIIKNKDRRSKLLNAKNLIEPYLDKDQQIEELLLKLDF